MAFLAGLLGPLLGGIFTKNTSGVTGAASYLTAQDEADQVSSLMTQAQLSHKSSQMTNLVSVRNEKTQETAMYDEYLIAVQGAQQNVIQKQEQLLDRVAQG